MEYIFLVAPALRGARSMENSTEQRETGGLSRRTVLPLREKCPEPDASNVRWSRCRTPGLFLRLDEVHRVAETEGCSSVLRPMGAVRGLSSKPAWVSGPSPSNSIYAANACRTQGRHNGYLRRERLWGTVGFGFGMAGAIWKYP